MRVVVVVVVLDTRIIWSRWPVVVLDTRVLCPRAGDNGASFFAEEDLWGGFAEDNLRASTDVRSVCFSTGEVFVHLCGCS